MRKTVFMLFILLTLFLNACHKDEEPPIDDDDKETYLYTHHVNKANFESFYDIDFHLELTEDGYEILLEVSNLFDFEPEFLNVSFIVYVTWETDTIDDETVHQIRQTQFKTFEHVFVSNDLEGLTKAYISEFDLSVVSGRVHTNRYIPIKTKAYPVIFEPPLDEDEIIAIDIQDSELNYANYLSLVTLFSNFDEVESNDFSFYYAESLRIQSIYQDTSVKTSSMIKMSVEPFYIAYETNDFTEIFIESPYDDQFIYFNMSPYQMINNRYVTRPIIVSAETLLAFLINIETDDEDGLFDDYTFDPEIMLFESITGGYLVTAYLKDFLSAEEFAYVVESYVDMGVDPEILNHTIVKFSVLSNSLSYRFNIQMVFNFTEPYEQTITTKTDYIFDFNPFAKITLDSNSIIVMPPRDIHNILHPIDPFDITSVAESPGPHYFKVYLEPGQYVMHTDHQNIHIDVLQSNMQKADQFVTYQNDYAGRFKNTFFIEDAGYYYLMAHSYYTRPSYSFFIEKLDFISNVHEPLTLNLGDNEININHNMELVAYQFDAPSDMVLKISGDASTLRYLRELSFSPGHYQLSNMFDFGEQNMFIIVRKGINLICFANDNPISFNLNVVNYGELLYKSDDLLEMPSIGTEFLDEPMLIGHGMGPSYLKFDAIHGLYTFFFDKPFDFLSAGIIVFDAETDQEVYRIYTDSTAPIIIQAGIYYLKIEAGNVFEFNLKYDVTPYENPLLIEEIESYPTYETTNEDFPYFEGLLYDFYHKPVHRFTLDEPATIVISTNPYHHLYDASGNLLTFNHLNYSHSRILYYLDAGTYDLIPTMTNPSQTFVNYKIRIAIVTDHIEQDNYYPNEPAIFLNEGGIMNFQDNHWYDYEFIKIVITQRVSYYLNGNKHFNVYDVNLNQIDGFSSGNTKLITFEVGTYYIVTHRFPIGNFRLHIFHPQ